MIASVSASADLSHFRTGSERGRWVKLTMQSTACLKRKPAPCDVPASPVRSIRPRRLTPPLARVATAVGVPDGTTDPARLSSLAYRQAEVPPIKLGRHTLRFDPKNSASTVALHIARACKFEFAHRE